MHSAVLGTEGDHNVADFQDDCVTSHIYNHHFLHGGICRSGTEFCQTLLKTLFMVSHSRTICLLSLPKILHTYFIFSDQSLANANHNAQSNYLL